MPDSPHTADIVELIRARAKQHPSEGMMSRQSLDESHVKYGQALLSALADEIERKSYDEDLSEPTLQGSAALPSEATLGVGDGSGQLFVHGSYEAIKRVQQMIFDLEAMRAAAQVQDDDAESKAVDEILRDWADGTMDAAGTIEDLLRIIDASRLSPTPDTGLIEALTAILTERRLPGTRNGPITEPRALAEHISAALANAAPAQS